MTVGATGFAGNNTDYSPGFAGSDGVNAFFVGNEFSETDGLVFNENPEVPVLGPDVVLMQVTIPTGNGFHLEGMIAWSAPSAGAIETPFVVVLFPAPGALALLGLAGLVGTRRRRFT